MGAMDDIRWQRNARRRALLLRGGIITALGMLTAYCGSEVGGGGSASGGGSATGGMTGSGGSSVYVPCNNPEPILQADDSDSGFVLCDDGSVNRVAAMNCTPDVSLDVCDGGEDPVICTTDADCTAQPNGTCRHIGGGGGSAPCDCVYPCSSDGDCDPGYACVCHGVVEGVAFAQCRPAGCLASGDCATSECGVWSEEESCGDYAVELACRTLEDTCRAHSECLGLHCKPEKASADWSCSDWGFGACGRPLLVHDVARTAATLGRDDWCASVAIDSAGVSPDVRRALVAQWQQVAALEHASVASFARFSLQLLTLGAPPDLLVDAQRAAADEIEHARLAYAIASAYAKRPLGPDALRLDDVPLASDRRSVLLSLVSEACVIETMGVAELMELATCVADPSLRAIYARIAADEQRHAELAWRALAWLLRSADDTLRHDVARAFDAAITAAYRDPAEPSVVDEAHGLLSARHLGHIRRQALEVVVRPCAAALGLDPALAAQLDTGALGAALRT